MTWIPINDYPGDQQFDDIPPTATKSFWGQIGREGDGWSWSIMSTDDACNQRDEAYGQAPDEAAAKRAVETWRPPR